MAKCCVESVRDLQAHVGEELFVTDWLVLEQGRSDGFAEATNDHQWIHVDRERARRESPFDLEGSEKPACVAEVVNRTYE